MAILKSDSGRDEAAWAALENFDRQPSEEDLRAAMRAAVAAFNQGHLTEEELNWVLRLLAAQRLTLRFERLLLDFGDRLARSPRRRFDLRGDGERLSSKRSLRDGGLSRVR